MLQNAGLLMTVLGVAIRPPFNKSAALVVIPYSTGSQAGLAGRF